MSKAVPGLQTESLLVASVRRVAPRDRRDRRFPSTLDLVMLVAAAALGLAVYATPAVAVPQADDAAARVSVWNATLDRAQAQLREGKADSALVDQLWGDVDRIREEAASTERALDSAIKDAKRLIGALGEKPAAGEPPESAEVVSQRAELEESLAALESLAKQANLAAERCDSLKVDLGGAKRKAVSEILLAHSPSPLDGETWRRAWAEFGELDSELRRTGRLLGAGALSFLAMLALALGVAGAIKLSGLAARGLLNRYGQAVGHVDPTYRQRVRAACIVAFSLGVVPAVLFVGWLSLIWYGLERYHVLTEQTIKPVSISLGIVFYFLFSALARAVLRPTTPAWRLIPISTESARILSRRIELLVLVLAVDVPFWRLLEMAGRPPAMSSVHTFVLSLALFLVTLSLLPGHLWRWQAVSRDKNALSETDARAVEARTLTSWLAGRWFAAAVFGGAWIASVLGYGNLGAYLTRGMLRMLLLLVVVIAVRGVVRETLTLLLTGHETRPREGFGVLNFWLITFSDLILSILGVIGTLLSWGVPWTGLLSAIHTAIGGFTVGTYRVVPADILLGVLVFSALVLITRFLQRQLEERILPKAHLDIGARTAIAAVTGYLGIGLAFVAAISIIGIDLSHLALIAGALSVGIGFGLQNIVNNFISGAILLAERPIKIGDWIVVGNIEGNVRRINIRATEIETFNRASVIVPNADLLQTSVTNWTYKNRRGRVDIPLGVDYKSDPDEIEAILLECAKQHASVLDWPAPYVLLQLFGDSSLDFELRVFVADIEQRHIVSSDLRKAVLRVFRSRGIEIPFPQRDVWVRVDQNGPEQPQADPLALSGSGPAG